MKKMKLFYDTDNKFKTFSEWHNGTVTYTPVYLEKDGKRYFLGNTTDADHKNREEEIQWYFNQLQQNDGKYFCLYCHAKTNNLYTFMEWIKTNDQHLQGARLDHDDDYRFVDFGGNLVERSCAFQFRIFDMKIIEEIKNNFPDIKIMK